jgi:homoserine O-acetyltransferase
MAIHSTRPVIVILGGISAHADVQAWWPDLVGPGRPVDTGRYRVVGFDFLETAPGGGPVTTRDQASALAGHLDRLGIGVVHTLVGASYGGMVALAFAAAFPRRLGSVVVISAAHESDPMTIAVRSIQRRIVRLGIASGQGAEALAIARGLAMTTYRTDEEFRLRFASEPAGSPPRWPVEDYLEARGRDWAGRVSPERFLALSESLDLHRVDPSAVRVPVTVVGVREDRLVPLAQLRTLAAALPRAAGVHFISSLYGHDAFLKEPAAIGRILRGALLQEAA